MGEWKKTTLDDKIELNRRMNRTMEKMAAAIFKSWFIDFDPVRAKAEGRDPDLPAEIADLTVLVPPSDAIAGFLHLVAPLHNRLMLNQRQNRRLAGLRETLLPKLLGGEIEAPSAEQAQGRAV